MQSFNEAECGLLEHKMTGLTVKGWLTSSSCEFQEEAVLIIVAKGFHGTAK